MPTLRVNDVLKDKILVSREAARLLEHALRAVIVGAGAHVNATDATPVAVDFEGVEGIAPSFLDELLSVFESVVGAETDGRKRCLMVTNPPTRLSLKFEAIARGHGMSIQALPDGSWFLTGTRDTSA
jgi:hypothetical protein